MINDHKFWIPEVLEGLRDEGLEIVGPYGKYIPHKPVAMIPRHMEDEIRIGEVSPSSLGDCICTTHLPRMLKEKYGCRVLVHKKGMSPSVFANNPYVDGFYEEDPQVMWGGREHIPGGHLIRQLSFLYGLDLPDVPKGELYFSDEEMEWANMAVSTLSKDKPIIIFCPNMVTRAGAATFPDWPWGKWFKILREFYHIIHPIPKKVKRQCRQKVDKTFENLTTRQFMSLMAVSHGYLGSSSGGTHVAAACGIPGLIAQDWTTDVPKNFHISPRMETWVYPYHLIGLHEHIQPENQPYVFMALARTGHHPVMNWILKQHPETVLFHQSGLRDDPRRPDRTQRYQKDTPDIRRAYNIENWNPYSNRQLEMKLPHAKRVLIVRDLNNWLASCIRCQWMGDIYQRLPKLAGIWDQHAWLAAHPPDWMYVISFDLWFSNSDYRQKICQEFGIAFTDVGRDDVPDYGWGSSFDRRKKHGHGSDMDVLNRWQEYSDHPVMLDLATSEREAANHKMQEAIAERAGITT